MQLKHTLILAGSFFGLTSQAQVLSWADRLVSSGTPYSAAGTASVTDATTDPDGNSYVAGTFSDTLDIDPGPGVSQMISGNGYGDGFVAKFDPSGALIWAKHFASIQGSHFWFTDMALRPGNGVALCGQISGTVDFDPSANDHSFTSTSNGYCFVCALNGEGLFDWVDTWGTPWGYFNGSSMNSLDVDPAGNIAAAAQFRTGIDIDPGPGVQTMTGAAPGDAFLLRLSGTGDLLWGQQLSASGGSNPTGVAVDAAGNAYIVGSCMDSIGSGSVYLPDPTPVGSNAFVMKFDASGTAQWGYLVAGTGTNESYDAVDANSAGDVIIAGTLRGSADIAPGPTVNTVAAPNPEPMLIGLDTDGGLRFSGALSISYEDNVGAYPYAVVIAENGDCAVTGDFDGTLSTGLFGGGEALSYYFSGSDAFLAKYDSNGGVLYSGTVKGDGGNTGRAVAFDDLGNLFFAGSISGTVDVDPGMPYVEVACPVQQGLLLKLGPDDSGVQSAAMAPAFSLSPNPANDQLWLTFPENSATANVAVIDAEGRTVRTYPVGSVRSLVLDVHGLSPGVYHLRADGPQGRSVQRFVKD